MGTTHRVAMIGCGRRAHHHAIGLLAEERAEVVALCDIKPEAIAALEAEFDFGAAHYTDYRGMVARERPDLVIACLWTPLHLPVFRDCVEAGIRCYHSEKPMAPTWGGCLEMGRLAQEHEVQLTFCHQRRFTDANMLVRKLIREGRFGDVLRMDLYSPKHLLDCGTHTVDQAMMFNDDTLANWVMGSVDGSDTVCYFDVPAECMAAGLIVFDNGVRASIQAGGPDMDLWGGVRVIGSRGFVEVTWPGQCRRAVIYDDPDWRMPEADHDERTAMERVISNAIDCLESGDEPELSWKKAIRAGEVIYALYESARSRRRVELPLSIRDHPFADMLATGVFETG